MRYDKFIFSFFSLLLFSISVFSQSKEAIPSPLPDAKLSELVAWISQSLKKNGSYEHKDDSVFFEKVKFDGCRFSYRLKKITPIRKTTTIGDGGAAVTAGFPIRGVSLNVKFSLDKLDSNNVLVKNSKVPNYFDLHLTERNDVGGSEKASGLYVITLRQEYIFDIRTNFIRAIKLCENSAKTE